MISKSLTQISPSSIQQTLKQKVNKNYCQLCILNYKHTKQQPTAQKDIQIINKICEIKDESTPGYFDFS